jgi:hypothetical protein
MTNKAELAARLDALEAEAKAIRTQLEAPEVDPATWIGKWGFAHNHFDIACWPRDWLVRLAGYKSDDPYPFYTSQRNYYRHFRPATPQELGFPDPFRPDWSTAPEWAQYMARHWFGLEAPLDR